jgi:hypothetical protein
METRYSLIKRALSPNNSEVIKLPNGFHDWTAASSSHQSIHVVVLGKGPRSHGNSIHLGLSKNAPPPKFSGSVLLPMRIAIIYVYHIHTCYSI